MTFEEKVIELDSKRKKLETIEAEIKKKKEEFEASISSLIESKNSCSVAVEDLKEDISEECLTKFKADGTKKFYGGLAIRENKKYEYSNEEALAWAIKTEMCLSLDKKKFETMAKTGEIEFVTVATVPSTTFPKEIKV